MHTVWTYINAYEIKNRLKQHKQLLRESLCVFVPKAANFIEKFLKQNKILYNIEKKQILIIDVICDSGSTLLDYIDDYKRLFGNNVEVKSLAIISKNDVPDITLFPIPDHLKDKWFFGFGMDLLSIKESPDTLRDWPAIGYCEKTVDKKECENHPIYMTLKSCGRHDLLSQCDCGDYYDFSKITLRTREVSS